MSHNTINDFVSKANQSMEVFENINSVAHYNYQDSNGAF
jgi:hypothetical protein